MSNLDITVDLTDLPSPIGTSTSVYDFRGPISSILLAGAHGQGVKLRLSADSTTYSAALVEAKAACAFAVWATEHADAVCAHATRLANELINELADSPADVPVSA